MSEYRGTLLPGIGVRKEIDFTPNVQLTVIMMPFPARKCRQYSHAARVRKVAFAH